MNKYFPEWMGAVPRANTAWSPMEDDKLKQEWSYTHKTVQDIAEIHGREENAILCRAEKLFRSDRDVLLAARRRRILGETPLPEQHEARTVTTSEYLKARCDELERRISNNDKELLQLYTRAGDVENKANLAVNQSQAALNEVAEFEKRTKHIMGRIQNFMDKFRGL